MMENYKSLKKIDIHNHAYLLAEYIPPVYNGHALISAKELIDFYDKIA